MKKEKNKFAFFARGVFAVCIVAFMFSFVCAQESFGREMSVYLSVENLDALNFEFPEEMYENETLYNQTLEEYENYLGETLFSEDSNYNISFVSAYVSQKMFEYEENEEGGEILIRVFYPGGAIEKRVSPFFMVLTNPPTLTPSTVVSVNFPYEEDVEKIEAYYKGELKLVKEFENYFCNFNGVCENEIVDGESVGENYLTCSFDCAINASDGICTTRPGRDYFWNDGLCDPDCYGDDDCIRAENPELFLEGFFEEADSPSLIERVNSWISNSISDLELIGYIKEWSVR